MATTRSFQDMLNEYLPDNLLKEELIKRDYVLTKVNKDNNWKGGQIIVPFKAAGASSVKFNGLTAADDISQSQYVRGTISAYKEVWGSLIFNQTDLMQHDGKINESTFLKVLPDTIEDFTQYMKEVVSNQLMGGPHFAKVVDATNAASGVLVVDRVEKFVIGQKFTLTDTDAGTQDVYVIAINLNAETITVSDTRGGSAHNVTTETNAANYTTTFPVCYYDGVTSAATTFNSLKSCLLSNANGGSANLHGQSKLLYPFLQAININGSDITALNLIEKLFDAYADIRRKARGNANEILMSYKHFGTAMKIIETDKTAFKVSENSMKASEYGWTEITLTAVATSKQLKFVGIQEMDDDAIMFLDWSGITFRSNGFFRKRTAPDGKQYYETRAVTGYTYIVDTCLFGELEFRTPGKCGIVYGINY